MPTRRSYSGVAPATRITTDLASGGTSFVVLDGTGYPDGAAGPFFVLLDRGLPSEEKVLIGSRSGNTFTVAASGRGQDGTIASAHNAEATVEHTVAAVDLDEANAHHIETTGAHGGVFLEKVAPLTAFVAASEQTSSTSYVDLASPGPTVPVLIGSSGRAVVIVGAWLTNLTAGAAAFMDFEVSGATTRLPATSETTLFSTAATASAQISASKVTLLTGLSPGATTFTAKYRAGSGVAQFDQRRLIVIPL